MDVKSSVLVLLAVALLADVTIAGITSFYRDLFYNRPLPKATELEALGLKCIPGRTVIRVTERVIQLEAVESDSDEFTRRKNEKLRQSFHGDDEERCSMCICSVDGNHEVCIKRPAGTVNECILMEHITKKSERNEPYEHLKSLAFRIRRVGDVDKAEEGNNDVKTCIPLVSEYTDCTPMNECTGCTKCGCSPSGQWDCRSIHQCDAFHTDKIDEELFDAALEKLEFELKTQNEATNRWKGGANQYTSQPAEKKNESDEILELKTQNEATDRWKGGAKQYTPQHAEKKNESDELLGYVIAVPRQQH